MLSSGGRELVDLRAQINPGGGELWARSTTVPSQESEKRAPTERGEVEAKPTDNLAPGSVVVVRDEEWFVRSAEQTADGLLVHVHGLSELVRDTTASFYARLDAIRPLDPAAAPVVGDDSPRYRSARLWLESTVRKTPLLIHPGLRVPRWRARHEKWALSVRR